MGDYNKMEEKTLEHPLPLNLCDANRLAKGLTSAEAEAKLAMYGYNEIPEHKEPLWWMYCKQFMGTMPMMIEIAAFLSALIKSWPDFIIIIALLFTNGTLGFIEERAAQASVDALKDGLTRSLPIIRDGKAVMLEVRNIVPGDVLQLRGGNVIPADCYFAHGDEMMVDQASLTGESLPVSVPRGDGAGDPGEKDWDNVATEGKMMYSGAILKQGECKCIVWKTGLYTMMGEAAQAIQEAGGKAEGLFEGKIIQAARVLIMITILVVFTLFYYNYMIVGKTWEACLESSLSLVIASVPVALPMVMKVTLSIGAGEMATHGGIVTHLTALEEIASMKVLCSDKTGTLTTAKMIVYPDMAVTYNGYTSEQVMEFAAVASNAANKDDPIDSAVFKAYAGMKDMWYASKPNCPKEANVEAANDAIQAKFSSDKYVGFNPMVKRTVHFVTDKKTGKKFQVSKGIISKVLATGDDGGVTWTVEDFASVSALVNKDDGRLGRDGYKTIGIAVGEPGRKMYYAGTLPIMDPPRADTAMTIQNIRENNVAVKMITGDHLNIAKTLAGQISLGVNIMANSELNAATNKSGIDVDTLVLTADGFAQVMPLDKLKVVDILQKKDFVVGMTGDGVNDAPALAKAQIGIAVEGATDAAQSAADIVLTRAGLSPINEAIMISRRIFKRLKSYVIYRICITVQVVFFLTAIAFLFNATFKPLYIILLALLHDLQIVTIAYDKQVESKFPETPTVMGLLLVSYTMGIFMAVQTTMLYSHGHFYFSEAFHCMPTATQVCEYKDSCVFLQISNSSAILILSARSVKWWFSSMAAWQIYFSAGIGQVIVNGIMLLPKMPYMENFIHPVTPHDIGLVWLYDFIGLFALDIVKQCMMWIWDAHEEATKVEDPFLAKQRRKSMNSTEGKTAQAARKNSTNIQNRKLSVKRA